MARGIVPLNKKIGRPTEELLNAQRIVREHSPVLAMAIKYAPSAMKVLFEIMQDNGAKHCDRINASTYIINRACGVPRKEVELTSDGKDITITINGMPAGKVVDADPAIDNVIDKRSKLDPTKPDPRGWRKGVPRTGQKVGRKPGRPRKDASQSDQAS